MHIKPLCLEGYDVDFHWNFPLPTYLPTYTILYYYTILYSGEFLLVPRKPNLHSGKSITIHAKTISDEERIRAFKEIHARNFDLEIQTTVMEAVNRFLAKHHYPPGNSQTLLFGETTKKCGECKEACKHLTLVECISGLRVWLCDQCLSLFQKRTVIKRVLDKR